MAEKPQPPAPALGPLGVSAADEQVYRELLRRPATAPESIADRSGLVTPELAAAVDRLVEAGLVRRAHGSVVAVPPDRLLSDLVDAETGRLREIFGRLEAVRAALPSLMSDQSTPALSGQEAWVESAPFADVARVLRELATTSTGDLLWIRPDRWHIEAGRHADDLVKELVPAGRVSRVIYPARVFEEAPETVRSRAAVGEDVRVLASLPTRLGVFGTSAAVIQEDSPSGLGRLLVLRHPSLVELVTILFDLLWERALNVPGLDGRLLSADRVATRRLLLEQLAHGAKDEQIARALGLSLRTVRRRVADLMVELDAGSRFQAGVEAVRRGWV